MPPPAAEITFSDGDGHTLESAVLIRGARHTRAGLAAEAAWIAKNRPDWRKTSQSLLHRNGRHYDRVECATPAGSTGVIYFDITEFFGRW